MIKPIERKKEIYNAVSDILKADNISDLSIDNFDDQYANIKVKNNYDVPVGAIVILLISKYKWFVNSKNPLRVRCDINGVCDININYKR